MRAKFPRAIDMATTTPHRRHSAEFKRQVCTEIRSGALGRREAQRKYRISDNLLQLWLAQYDADALASVRGASGGDGSAHAACEARIAALERKIGQLLMALEQSERAALDAPRSALPCFAP
jgi:transposase-like protein